MMPVNQNKRGENSIKKNIAGVHCPNPPNLTLFTVTLRPQQNRHGLPLLRRLNCKWRENVDRFVVCMQIADEGRDGRDCNHKTRLVSGIKIPRKFLKQCWFQKQSKFQCIFCLAAAWATILAVKGPSLTKDNAIQHPLEEWQGAMPHGATLLRY